MSKQKHTFYQQDVVGALKQLNSSQNGLSPTEAEHRLKHFGPNVLTSKGVPLWKKIIEPFYNIFVSILLLAIFISVISGKTIDAIIVSAVVVMNAFIFYVQQFSVAKALKDLKSQEKSPVTVVRGGKPIEIESDYIVPGDIIYLFEGMKVPADGRVIEAESLSINESMLTGESLPVAKYTAAMSKQAEIFDQTNMVFKGTVVQSGSGQFVATATGNHTEIGGITKLIVASDLTSTPIEKKIDSITKKLVSIVTVVGTIVFILSLFRGTEITEALRFSLALAVAAVPEGLPVTLTIVLLLSAKKMAKSNALIKRLSSIETLGAITLIATDKTGTLTQNSLSISEVHGNTAQLNKVAAHAIIEKNGIVADPLDAILKDHFLPKHKPSGKHIKDFPFNQDLLCSGSLWEYNGKKTLFLKGAPEALLPQKNITASFQKSLDQFTAKGYRTLAFSSLSVSKTPNELSTNHINNATLAGLVAFSDPLRPEIPEAVQHAKEAGIHVVMLTGDHINTAQQIALQAGIIHSNDQQVIDGTSIDKMDASQLASTIQHANVFARVLPKHKYAFLKAIKGKEITAMTGDGVNDTPALVEADAGLSMGSGTDAAKDVSDIILMDDNFATIVKAIELGRTVIANIKKMLFYLLTTSVSVALTTVGSLALGLPLPVTAIQILWINIVTDGFTVLPLGLSPGEKHHMTTPPNNPKAPLLSIALQTRIIVNGLTMAAMTLFVYNYFESYGEAYATAAAFATLASVQWANALNANFEKASWIKNFAKPNLWLFGSITVALLVQLAAMYGPFSKFFGVAPLAIGHLVALMILPCVILLLVSDLHKLITKVVSKPAA